MSVPQNKIAAVKIISTYVASDYKLLYLYTSEESKTMKILEQVARETDTQKIYTYDIVRGLQCEKDKKLKYRKKEEKTDIYKTLEFIADNIEGKSFVVFKDIHTLFETDHRLARAFKNCINDILNNHIPVNLFVISPVLHIPPEIEKEAVVIDIPLPSRDEIEEILNRFLEKNDFHGVREILKSKLIEALNGLTEIEVQNILQFCVQDGEIDDGDINTIIDQKKQLIRKGGVLEFVKPEENIGDIGGLDRLKGWLKRKKGIFDQMEKAKEFKVDIPKGVLLLGMPGCGKSLTAKVIIAIKCN